MPFTVTMPKLSPTMEEGTIVKWHKKEGDKVQADELLIEVATDKATVEYNALDEGFLRKILVPEGQMARVNQPVAIFTESADEKIDDYKPEGAAPATAEPAQEKAPKAEGEQPAAAAKPAAGAGMQQPAFVPEPPLEHYEFAFPAESKGRIAASPLAKKLAKEKGLDLSSVKGSGPGGRVTSKDVDMAQPGAAARFGSRELPTIIPGTYEEVPLSPMRKAIGKRLQQSKTFIPHVYIRQDIDAGPMIALREQLKNASIKISFNDFVIRACALALREHPHVNSGFNSVDQKIILFKTIDISVAVAIDQGLITPIIRHADYKDLGEINVEVKELATRAKAGKLEEQEYKGGSFTISNMGMFGINDFAAVINPPQSAILAVGGIFDFAVVKEGQVVPGKKMGLTLSCDHRVIDGADGARFLVTVQKYLQNPVALIV